jgi:competence ComEA-like helix-hairpin-helix protein
MPRTLTPFSCIGLTACALVVSTLLATAAGGKSPAPQTPASASDEASAALFTRMCSDCHDSTRIVSPRRTRAEWEDIIHNMIDKGASGTEKEFESVFDYLLLNYGKTDINKASSDELMKIVGLSKKDADTLVAYRTAKGPFADFEAVKKVPDIDLKKLDEHKDAIVF